MPFRKCLLFGQFFKCHDDGIKKKLSNMGYIALNQALFSFFFFFNFHILFVIRFDHWRNVMQLDWRCKPLSCVWLVVGSILDLSSRDSTVSGEPPLQDAVPFPVLCLLFHAEPMLQQPGSKAAEKGGKLSLLICTISVQYFLGSSQKSLHTAALSPSYAHCL